MAVAFMTGAEAGEVGLDGVTLGGTVPATYSAVQARTGSRSIRCTTPGTTNDSAYVTIPATLGWLHFGLYMVVKPSSLTLTYVDGSGNTLSVNTTSRLSITGQVGTTVLALNTWYWIGVRRGIAGSFTGVLVTLDGVPEINGTVNPDGTLTASTLSTPSASTLARDIYFDDIIIDAAGFLAPSKVIDLLPTANSAVGTGWTLGSGGTTGQWDAVNNQPPTAVADAGTTAQIRNAANAANSNYDATLQTYTVGGVGTGDTVLAVQPIVSTAAPLVTSAKLGTVGNVSNPAITNVNLAAGGTAGAFWSGVAGGTYPTGWKVSQGTLTTGPTVTLGTAPVMRVTQVTGSTRIAMVAYMALRVAWTPAAAAAVPYSTPYPQVLPQ